MLSPPFLAVSMVMVSLEKNCAVVSVDDSILDEMLKAVVDGAGFTVKNIEVQ